MYCLQFSLHGKTVFPQCPRSSKYQTENWVEQIQPVLCSCLMTVTWVIYRISILCCDWLWLSRVLCRQGRQVCQWQRFLFGTEHSSLAARPLTKLTTLMKVKMLLPKIARPLAPFNDIHSVLRRLGEHCMLDEDHLEIPLVISMLQGLKQMKCWKRASDRESFHLQDAAKLWWHGQKQPHFAEGINYDYFALLLWNSGCWLYARFHSPPTP